MSELGSIPDEGRVLGIDPGTKRIGVASGGVLGFVHPLGFLNAEPRAEALRRIVALAVDRDCVGLVVGLPLNMNGTEGPSAKAARELARELAEASRLPVEVFDERLTSWEAERDLLGLGLTKKRRKERVDALAAARILEGFVEARELRRRRKSEASATPEDVPPARPAEGAPEVEKKKAEPDEAGPALI